ncbi:MAG TPA: hypothetical protein PLX62_12635 [Bacteroidales bacterium]|nr:hypothetical protein [Bacteroidales bacterium]
MVVILPVLIGELELGAPGLDQFPFPFVQLPDLPHPIFADIVAALVESDLLSLLPSEQGMVTVRAVVLRLSLESTLYLKEPAADLAQHLTPLLPVIIVEILMGRIAKRAHDTIRHAGRPNSMPYRG